MQALGNVNNFSLYIYNRALESLIDLNLISLESILFYIFKTKTKQTWKQIN